MALASGQAAYATSGLSVGTHVITATYGGDANDNVATGTLSPSQTIGKAAATINLGNLNQTYAGTPRSVTATTNPISLTVVITYTGTSGTTYGPTTTAPTNAGSYAIDAAVDDTNYQGTATGTLVVAKADPTIVLASSPNPSTFGASVYFTATVSPAPATGTLQFYADGSTLRTLQTLTGSRAAINTIVLVEGTHVISATYNGDNNINGGTATLSPDQVVGNAAATVTLSNLDHTYDGTAKAATATTDPTGLTVVMTYTGISGTTFAASTTAPTNAGAYRVDAVIQDEDYQGTATGTLVIAKAATTVDDRQRQPNLQRQHAGDYDDDKPVESHRRRDLYRDLRNDLWTNHHPTGGGRHLFRHGGDRRNELCGERDRHSGCRARVPRRQRWPLRPIRRPTVAR